jgi:hypothetical protein
LNAQNETTWQFQSGDSIRLRFSYEVGEPVSDLGFIFSLMADGRIITTIREPLSERPLTKGHRATFDLILADIPLRPCELSIYAALGRLDCTSFYDVVDANVDLPLLFIGSDTTDIYARQGMLSLDYRLQPIPANEPAS